VLWRERTTGSTFIWMMDGAHLIGGTGYTTLFADATWSVQALADFNGDGRGDLLWRAADGALYVWVSKEPHPQYGLDYDGRAFTGAYLDTIGTDWQVAAVGDMNGDGNSDILWRQVGTGATYVWMMNGGQVVAGTGPTAAQADERWVVEGLGDFDGDGKSDILWRNVGGPDTGAMYVWLMNGTQLWGSTYLDPISTDWQVEGLADFNGDAKTDVLWRNRNAAAGDAGFLYIWMMDGPTVIAGTGYTAAQADFSWQVQTPR
jgi:hypothetical protein